MLTKVMVKSGRDAGGRGLIVCMGMEALIRPRTSKSLGEGQRCRDNELSLGKKNSPSGILVASVCNEGIQLLKYT